MTVDELKVRVGGALRQRRKADNLSLLQVAAKAGISLGFLSQVERGRNTPSIHLLAKVCGALGLTLEAFFALVEAQPEEKHEPRA